jgi:hypothetical protein
MKAANRAGARSVVILGEQELAAGRAAVHDMAARQQVEVALDAVVARVGEIAARRDTAGRPDPGLVAGDDVEAARGNQAGGTQ